jgi:hypothetical protein
MAKKDPDYWRKRYEEWTSTDDPAEIFARVNARIATRYREAAERSERRRRLLRLLTFRRAA